MDSGAIAGGLGGAGVLDQDTVRFFSTWYARSEVARVTNLPLVQAYSYVTMKSKVTSIVVNNSLRATGANIFSIVNSNKLQDARNPSAEKSYLETSNNK